MVVEVLGIFYENICVIIVDIVMFGYNDVSYGFCVIYVLGFVIIKVVCDVVEKFKICVVVEWGIDLDVVIWEDGYVKFFGLNVGEFELMYIIKIIGKMGCIGGLILGYFEVILEGVGVFFGIYIVDVEVDFEIGKISIICYMVV